MATVKRPASRLKAYTLGNYVKGAIKTTPQGKPIQGVKKLPPPPNMTTLKNCIKTKKC